jgi:hypothetical protein
VTDVSHLGKVELRGALEQIEPGPGEELVRLRDGLGLLITEGSPAGALERASRLGLRAYDVTSALAALEFSGEDALRRLTELDPRLLPMVGSVARDTRAVIQDRGDGSYRLLVPQELGHYVAEVVLDTLRGLGR